MTEKISRRLPEGSWTEDEDNYVETWNQLGTAVAKFFPGYWLGGYDPGIRLDNNVETIRFSVTQAKLLLQTQAEKQAEIDALQEEVSLLRAEVRKQVFGSRVVFDREVVARAKKEEGG